MEYKQLTGYPSIDKPWLKYYSGEAINAKLPECTIYENIRRYNGDYQNDIALEYYGCKITYRKLFREVERTAKALRQAGVQKGDCVALCMAGVPEAVYTVLACSRIGAVANLINPMFTTEQMIRLINDSEADILIVLDAMYRFIADTIDQTCVRRVVVVPATGSLPAPVRALAKLKSKPDARLSDAMQNRAKYVFWHDFIKVGKAYSGQVDEPYIKDRPVVMVYSSGTTGASKGIALTNDGINATIQQDFITSFAPNRQERFLFIIPIWFSTGVSLSLLAPLCLGARLYLEPTFSNENFVKDLLRYKPTYFVGITNMWLYALSDTKDKQINLSFVKCPMEGGEPLLARTENQINVFLYTHGCRHRLNKGWGRCELGGTVTFSFSPNGLAGDVGIPLPLVTVAAFDPISNEELLNSQHGELRVISPSRMLGYYKNPEATAEFFRTGKDGQVWACTGDIGYVDEDGNVFVLGRASDCYTAPDGTRYYLFDAENVILQDEAVDLCEVVDIPVQGIPLPVAHLLLNKECSDAPEAVIRRVDTLCRAQLDPYAVPRGYKVREGFAVKPSGKRDTEALKQEREGFYIVLDSGMILSQKDDELLTSNDAVGVDLMRMKKLLNDEREIGHA